MRGSVSLGRIFGIQFRLHYTWFIIFLLITFSLVYPNFSHWINWIIGVITSLLLFTSVVAHELAHSLVGRANGIKINSITLFIFGGVAQMDREVTNPHAELKMAVAGPLCSLAIGIILGSIWWIFGGMPEIISRTILWLASVNLILGVFNLIPGFPLDGGRVFRSLLWRITGSYFLATRIATKVGQGIGYLFILGGVMITFLNPLGLSWFDGVWIAFIGWFLQNAASGSYRQMRQQEELINKINSGVIPFGPTAVIPDETKQ